MQERFAIHKLVAYGVRPIRERTKSAKYLLHAAAIVELCLENGRKDELKAAWDNATGRGKGWDKGHQRADRRCFGKHPSLTSASLRPDMRRQGLE
jgi:hypothetical protein